MACGACCSCAMSQCPLSFVGPPSCGSMACGACAAGDTAASSSACQEDGCSCGCRAACAYMMAGSTNASAVTTLV
eukprot:130892-Chlamydomonas_euryale.AAC.2